MARLEEREYTYFKTVRGMCRTCRNIVPARVYFQDGNVWQQSICPTCSNTPALIASDVDWYLENISKPMLDRAPLKESHTPVRGCPHDCGPCAWHASPCQLPVISVTNACDMDCPICFTYNRPDKMYHMPVAEMQRTVDWVIQSSETVDLINITGGEPTMHPEIIQLLECCQRPEIGRITMNSNGVRLSKDMDLCRRLGQMGVHVILSFNTFSPQISIEIHGRDVVETKLKAIDNLGKAGVKMTLLNVMIRDTNEKETAGILDLMRQNDNILSLTVQTMTYTGQGGGQMPKRLHIPVDEAARTVCSNSSGMLEFSDFLSRPSAHPLCYLTCYMLKAGDSFLPFARFAQKDKLLSWMKDSYLIRLEGEDDFFKDVINDLYAEGNTKQLKLFRDMIETLYPSDTSLSVFERQKLAESSVRTVYIHTHMDEDNFDCSRAMMCPDLVPAEPGKLIPACTYNLFYRMKDERFYVNR
jgi:uncharacterized radical SAM superfamily Fe-S cluster-containing enzyme